MRNKNNKFRHLHKKDKNDSVFMSMNSKKSIVIILGLFLLLFPKYAPFESLQVNNGSYLQQAFIYIFFVTNQTLGIIHESGHGVCYILPCPQFIMVLNGTLFQLAFPLGIAYYYKRKGNLFAAYIALFFVGFSLQYTAWYISTAHEGLHLPAHKSFLGVDGNHDFNYLLDTLGLLAYNGFISGLAKLIAYGIMLWAVVQMFFDAFKSVEVTNQLKDD